MSLLFQTSPAVAFADTTPDASARSRAGCGASLASPRRGIGSLCRAEGRRGRRARESLQQVLRAPEAQRRAVSCGVAVWCLQGSVGRSEKQTAKKGPSACLEFSCPSGSVSRGRRWRLSWELHVRAGASRTAGVSLRTPLLPAGVPGTAQGWPCPRGQQSSPGALGECGALGEGPRAMALLRLAGS